MHGKKFLLLALIGGSAAAHDMPAAPPGDSSASLSGGDSLPALVAEALRGNRGIKARAYEVKALHSSPSHAWYLDPPQLGVEFYQAPARSFPDPLKNQMEIDYSLQQTVPFPGKISARIKAEHKHAEMGEAELGGLQRRIVREVKVDYYELYLLDRRMEINRESRALLARLVDIARRQYEVGAGRQADILRAQTELTRMKADSLELAQARASAQGMLNARLDRKTDRPLAVAADLEPAETDWTWEQIRPVVEKYHPALQARRASLQMREAEKSMARRDFLPDFTVGGAFKNMLALAPDTHGGALQNYWSLMIAMDLPIAPWSLPKYRAGLAQGDAGLRQSEEEYSDEANMVMARAQQALLKARSGRELARLSSAVLLPQAQQALESDLAAYQGGKSEFTALLDSYRMRLMARENAEMTLAGLLTAQAELEEAVGLDLEEIGRKISGGDKP
jgi:cobalt-zinc-cadmium efflux system outer membrane protein